MLHEDTKAAIRDAIARLQQLKPGFRRRGAQNKLIAEIARAAAHEPGAPTRLVAEAPTGTGKSLAYLVGAFLPALKRDKQVVVATATVALQEQLLKTDLPGLAEHAGLKIDARLAKGRSHYGCDVRINRLDSHDADQIGLDLGLDTEPLWDVAPSKDALSVTTAMASERRAGRWDGDLDVWPAPISDELRQLVTATRSQCLGKSCPLYDKCPFVVARRGLLAADVMVINQNLLLSDLAMGGGAILKAPEDYVLVIDEAHHFPAKAVEQFACHVEPDALAASLGRIHGPLAAAFRALGVARTTVDAVAEEIEGLRLRLMQMTTMLEPARAQSGGRESSRRHAPRAGAPGQEIMLTAESFAPLWDRAADALPLTESLATRLSRVIEDLQEAAKERRVATAMLASLQGKLGPARDRLAEAARLFSWLGTPPEGLSVPIAKWAQWHPGSRGGWRVSASPVTAAHMLQSMLWERADTVIMTSATLSSLGTFDRYLEAMGLDEETTGQLQLPSPFNLYEQAEVIVHGGAATRERADAHTADVATLVAEKFAPAAGTLVLFCSHHQMRTVFEQLPPSVQALVQRQGEASRDVLLAEHARRVSAGASSILFGVQQLSEGIDLKGDLCRVLIIAKLPFAVPDNPIEQTREAWIRGQGRDYFKEVVVPDAHLRLVQMCGRLIRSETDTGTIYIADGRLATTRYGRSMLANLPPFRCSA